MNEHVITITLDDDVYNSVAREAIAAGTTVERRISEILELDFAAPRDGSPYDVAFRAAVEEALREADSPDAVWHSNEEVMADSRRIISASQRRSVAAH